MSTTATLPPLTYRGETLEAEHVEPMRDATPLLGDMPAMRERMAEDGYIYLPGYLGRERVLAARKVIVDRLAKSGTIDPNTDPMDAIPNPSGGEGGFAGGVLHELFANPQPVDDVLYGGPMMEFFRGFLAAPVLHFDFTWMRQVRPGPSTEFHSDVVYMGRGTHELFTAWTPMGDNNFTMGGLLVLAGSNRFEGFKKSYWESDVDAFCTNKEDKRDAWAKGTNGSLRGTAKQLRNSIGGHWVTSDYRAGDVVIFSTYTVHGGTDNRSNRLRISTDTRYQRASESVDERWIGEKPPAHGPAGKLGLIC